MSIKRMPTALLFPGQAAHYIGMGRDFYDEFSAVRKTFQIASGVADYDMARLCFEDPQDRLKLTEYAQPAIVTVSLAVAELIKYNTGFMPFIEAVAGHSLGEMAALAFAKSFTLADALRLVIARAKAMQRAVPIGQGKMAAIIGLDFKKVQEICQQATQDQVVTLANINAADQVVIAGHTQAVDHACQLSAQAGAKRIIALKVSAPFHCPLMEPAAHEFERAFSQINLRPTKIPVYRNVDNSAHQDPLAIQKFLVRQLTSPVNWPGMIEALKRQGIEQFVIVCPGKVLGGLMRRIDRSLPFFIVEDSASFNELAFQFPKKEPDLR